jgi:hypothetical protein
MLFTKKTPPPVGTEPNGFEFRLRLSEESVLKLIPVVVTILVGSVDSSPL